jgi:hypothetical protein
MLGLKIRDAVLDKLDGYDPVKINGELFVIKHLHQIDSKTVKLEIITTNHAGIKTLNGNYQVKNDYAEAEILNADEFAELLSFDQIDNLITLLEPNDYGEFLQNIIDFGRMFNNAQYRVIQVAANKVLKKLMRMANEVAVIYNTFNVTPFESHDFTKKN